LTIWHPRRSQTGSYALTRRCALLATPEQLEYLPPALVLVAEHDLLRDEGEEYARKLAEARVEVTAVRYLSTFHGFMMLDALAETPAAKGAIELVSHTLRKALGIPVIERAPAKRN
jgi:acetyl esterase/lipase